MSEQVTYQRYLTYFDYFETGCGRTICIGLYYADDSRHAIQKHIKDIYPNDRIAQDYIQNSVDSYLVDSKEAREILNMWFVSFLYEKLLLGSRGDGDFSFKFHYNLS